jgi:predicted transcriptional regulator of viral defense system
MNACRRAKARQPNEPWNWWRPINSLYEGLSDDSAGQMTPEQIDAAYETEQETWRRAAATLEKRGVIERRQGTTVVSGAKRGTRRSLTIASFVRLVPDAAQKESEVTYWRSQRQATSAASLDG